MRQVLVWLVAALIRLVGATLRMTVEDGAGIFYNPDHPPVIMAFWHNRVGLSAYLYERYTRGRTCYTFISLSRDGQYIAEIAERFGVKAVRGSSSRKGMRAALEAVRAARDPRADLVITPDGPNSTVGTAFRSHCRSQPASWSQAGRLPCRGRHRRRNWRRSR